jgi:hypothetical protein
MIELGGRRPVRPDSHNLAWRNASFRGYADYMETQPFLDGIERLLEVARTGRTTIMCSEAVWWRCHRSLIADYLKAAGVLVFHILSPNRTQEHPYTSAARLVSGLAQAAHAAAPGLAFCGDSIGGMFGIYFAAEPPGTYAEVMATDKEQFNRFFHAMLDRGVYLAPSAFEAGFVSMAHDLGVIDTTVMVAREAFGATAKKGGG